MTEMKVSTEPDVRHVLLVPSLRLTMLCLLLMDDLGVFILNRQPQNQ